MTTGTDNSSLPMGVPKHIWIIVAVVTVLAINAGLTIGDGRFMPGLGMRSQVELANVEIDNPDKLTRSTTTMVPTLSLTGELTNNSRDTIWQIEFEVQLYACPKGGGESIDDCSEAKDVSVLASVDVPPGETRSFDATGYLSSKDLPIGDGVRWTTKVERIQVH
jgi:hypothetical protein